MTDITIVVGAIITLISAICAVFILPYIKAKTTASQRESVQAWINIAVAAAEQLFSGSGHGAEKKAAVLKFLEERGITYDETAVDVMVEAAVKRLKIDEGA